MGIATEFQRFDAFLFDLDGVIYKGDEPVPHAAEAVRALGEAGKRTAFLTNNATVRPEDVADRLGGMGILVEPQQVVTSALATADHLRDKGIRSAYVVGEAALIDAVASAGVTVAGGVDLHIEAVVVGLDRDVTYAKLRDAALQIQGGAMFIAANIDPSLPMPKGAWPGSGALVGAIAAASGAVPEVVGKPNPPLFRSALERAGGGVPLMIGDRLDTDIAGALALGWDAALVLTGVSTLEEAKGPGAPEPGFVLEDLRGLLA
jgi:glycerol-1-phosphatase